MQRIHWHFRARAWLTRLGLWDRLERWRMARRFRRGAPHEPDYLYFRDHVGPPGLFLDVGANVGQSALSFRCMAPSWPILSLEPNRALEPALRNLARRLGPSFTYRMIALGERTESRTLHIPTVAGIEFSQLASLDRAALEHNEDVAQLLEYVTGSRSFTIQIRTIDVVRGDELMLAPGVIKLDVEGGELAALRGLEQTIRTHRPLILVESYGPVEFLESLGYERLIRNPDTNELRPPGERDEFLNSFFVPRQSVQRD
jgi:FkbM family methyltransferase